MAGRAVPPGRLRRRLTIAFVLVAGVSAGLLAGGTGLLLRQSWWDASLREAAADARYQLVLAGQFLPLTEQRSADLLASFEAGGRHVVLVDGPVRPSHPAYVPELGTGLRATVAGGQLGFQRSDPAERPRLLVVGGRIPGSTAELYVLTVEDDVATDLGQLRNALVAGWVLVVLLAAGVGHALARRTLEPVGRASRAARALTEGLLATRLPVRGRDEFSVWAATFNEMAEALESKIGALSAAEARERRFTADVAHELRTPVTALVAAASLLREHLDQLPDDARPAARLLVGDVVRLRRLVEDLMEISRLDAGRERPAVEAVDASALLHGIVAARGWSDRVLVDGDAVTLRTDRRRLERVLANLVANAVEHGGGEIRATVVGAGPLVVFEVTDQGPGIPAEHLSRVFDRFHQVDRSRSAPSSGLGLAIAREHAVLLGGVLSVRSGSGAGACFRLELPATGPTIDDGHQRAPGGGFPADGAV
ncbi:HAMP domain-containing sensor histidine kinase [Micromonospora sp. WMMD964]|uniref:sensor histidine kinase n=1 Tax=Micromonospora sp. WMMD964 TaxID=3016091 RepID=UPI00249A473B|nr:HAMP domain-containing sensor histidine kinase [Micromonospora sp. WMMD964]WFE98993.1 HAMP domain-containing sensor histidine kinase [Micromonospora sp. WMMD964]